MVPCRSFQEVLDSLYLIDQSLGAMERQHAAAESYARYVVEQPAAHILSAKELGSSSLAHAEESFVTPAPTRAERDQLHALCQRLQIPLASVSPTGTKTPSGPAETPPRDDKGKFVPRTDTRSRKGRTGSSTPGGTNKLRQMKSTTPGSTKDGRTMYPTPRPPASPSPAGGQSQPAGRGAKESTPAAGAESTADRAKRLGPCTDCGHPFHRWATCPRNKENPFHNEAAATHQGSGKIYDGKWDSSGKATYVEGYTPRRPPSPAPRARIVTLRTPTAMETEDHSASTAGETSRQAASCHWLRQDPSGMREINVDGFINDVPQPQMVVDTGAQVTILSAERYWSLFNSGKIGPLVKTNSTPDVEMGNGQRAVALGTTTVWLGLHDPARDRCYFRTISMLVLPNLASDVLLGLDYLHHFVHTIDVGTGELKFRDDALDEEDDTLRRHPVVSVFLIKPLSIPAGRSGLATVEFKRSSNSGKSPPRYLIEPAIIKGTEPALDFSMVTYAPGPSEDSPRLTLHIVNRSGAPIALAAGTVVAAATPLAAKHVRRIHGGGQVGTTKHIPPTNYKAVRMRQLRMRRQVEWAQHELDLLASTLLTEATRLAGEETPLSAGGEMHQD